MKKILIFLGSFIALILLALAVLPFLFKDKIKVLIQEQAGQFVNADIYFEDVGLSFYKDFPNACIGIQNFGVLNRSPFQGDTLVSCQNFELSVDLMSVIGGDQIRLNKVSLIQPRIKALVHADGQANWDISLPDTTAMEESSGGSGNFAINLQKYSVEDAYLYYEDATLPMKAVIQGLNHSGAGDFTSDDFDLQTLTSTEATTIIFDGISYLNKARLEAELDLNINTLGDMVVRVLKANFSLNDLHLGMDGSVAMAGEDVNLDLNYASQDTRFKSILSLIPGAYTQDFENVKTEGSLSLDGFVKGTYNEQQLPGFGFDLVVMDAMFQYPDLPTPVTGIEIDMHLNEPDGSFTQTLVDIKSFQADLGNNPIKGTLRTQGVENMAINADINAKLNLSELTSMFPMEGNVVKGIFSIEGKADGIYNESQERFPEVDAIMSLSEGYVKSADYPTEITGLMFDARMSGVDQDLKKAVLEVPTFQFALDGEEFTGSMQVKNFSDPEFDLKASGTLNLDKLTQIYPLDSMSIGGTVIVDAFSTHGKMSDIEQERYTQIPTSGKVRIDKLVYNDYLLAHDVTIDEGSASFSPQRLDIQTAKGYLGKSDYQIDGYVSNYLAYALMDNQPLTGQMNLRSNRFDLNEWMAEDEITDESEAAAEEVLEAYPIPKNLDLHFNANIKEVTYTNLNLKDFRGDLQIVDEGVKLHEMDFNTLGATVKMEGFYSTKNIEKPTYSLISRVEDLNIGKAYSTFSSIKAFAPITQLVDGIANTSFAMNGVLSKNLLPILETISSEGAFEVTKGTVGALPSMDKIASLTKLDALKSFDLAGAKGWFTIQNGFMEVDPFDIKSNDMVLTLGGRQSITGAMDYDLELDIPAGKAGKAALGALANLTGGAIEASERIQLSFKIGGTYDNPEVSGLKSSASNQVADQVSDALEQTVKKELGVDVEVDSLKQQADDLKQQAVDSSKTVVKKTQKQVEDSVKAVMNAEQKKAEEALEKKIEEQLGKEAKDKLDDLKNKFKFGKKKK